MRGFALLLVVSVIAVVFPVVAALKADEVLNVYIIPHSHCDPGALNFFVSYRF
jgi:hypothetical protein